MLLSKDNITSFIEMFREVDEKITELVDIQRDIDEKYYTIDYYEFTDSQIVVNVTYYKWQNDNFDLLCFPLSLLYDENEYKNVLENSAKTIKEKQVQKELELLNKKEEIRKKELAELQRLMSKYGEDAV